MTTKTKNKASAVKLDGMCSISIRRRGHLQAKIGAAILNKEIRELIENAIEFYLQQKSPESLGIFRKQHPEVEV